MDLEEYQERIAAKERTYCYIRNQLLEKEGLKKCKVCGLRRCVCQSVIGDYC